MKLPMNVYGTFRPDVFEFEELEDLEIDERLEAVFDAAYDHLGVEMLLDPEDVNCKDPDKKSIIMYITSLFRVRFHVFLLRFIGLSLVFDGQ